MWSKIPNVSIADYSGVGRKSGCWSTLAVNHMRPWNSRPILFTVGLGAAVGTAVAVILMSTVGHVDVVTNRLLLALWPTAVLGAFSSLDQPDMLFSLTVVVVEVVGNALLYALVFSIPVGFVVAIRRSFGKTEKPPSIGPA